MKKALLLCLTLLAATFVFAQQQLATLNHNDSISVFYGASALQQAHAAAVNGDIITLSPGSFNSVDITKAITIRGAGMFPDTVTGIGNTTLLNHFTLNIAYDPLHNLIMEGINCTGETMSYSTIYNPQFSKCLFRNIQQSGNNSRMRDALFTNCIINNFISSYSSNPTDVTAGNILFVNCVILNNTNLFCGGNSLINCVAMIHRYPNEINQISISNSIVYCNDNQSHWGGVNAYTSFNSIGINTCYNCYFRNFYDPTGVANHYLYNFNSYASVFKNFRGTYGEGITFELQDSIAQNVLGNDGTQVGIYGGNMPFDPRVSGLNIRRLDVARRTTADGRLAVDIEVVNEESTNTTEEE